jgi:cytochrome c peroxidase
MRGSRLVAAPIVLALALAMQAGASATAGSVHVSERGGYRVRVEPATEPLVLNAWQRVLLHVERTDDAPLALLALSVDGGMPAHGHGLPSAPRVRSANGQDFVIEGLRFNMAGRWELRVLLSDRAGNDLAVVPLEIGPTPEATIGVAFSASERATLRSLALLGELKPPADPSNRVADDPRAVALGHRLFFDRKLSGGGRIACASCHEPAKHFADGRVRGRGLDELARNTPSLVGVAFSPWLFWDGRRDSLWSQALQPLEAPVEMNAARLDIVRYVASHPTYRADYIALFGAPPKLAGLPLHASPIGDERAQAAWNTLQPAQQEAIDRAFANVGKAIAAYERRLLPGRSAFDRYVEALENGEPERASKELSPAALAGMKMFLSPDMQCLRCHNGPMFSNQGFHNIGTGKGSDPARPDFGRAIGIEAVQATEFNCAGPYSDDAEHACPELRFLNRHDETGTLTGAYKVPSLRNAAATAPYMHDGRFATLADVMEHYRNPRGGSGALEFRPLFDVPASRLEALVAFIESLRAPVAAPDELVIAPEPATRARRDSTERQSPSESR